MSANGRSLFHIFLTAMTNLREVLRATKDTTSKPDGITLDKILRYIDLDGLGSWSGKLLILLETIINSSLDLLVQSLIEVFEHSCSTREDDVFIKSSTSIDRARLDRIVYNFIKRCSPVIVNEFRVEEHFRSQKSLISYINLNCCAWASFVRVFLKFVWLHDLSSCRVKLLLIIFLVFFDNIFADISVSLFYLLRNFHWVFGGNRLSTISHLL